MHDYVIGAEKLDKIKATYEHLKLLNNVIKYNREQMRSSLVDLFDLVSEVSINGVPMNLVKSEESIEGNMIPFYTVDKTKSSDYVTYFGHSSIPGISKIVSELLDGRIKITKWKCDINDKCNN